MKLIQLEQALVMEFHLSDNTRINTDFEFSKNEIKCSTMYSQALVMNLFNVLLHENDEFKMKINWNENTLNDYLYPTQGVNNASICRYCPSFRGL